MRAVEMRVKTPAVVRTFMVTPTQRYYNLFVIHTEDSESSSSSSSRSGLSGGSRASARRRVGGARDRYIFGTLNDAVVGCQEGLTCVQVDFGRRECRPDNSTENPEGKYTFRLASSLGHSQLFNEKADEITFRLYPCL